MKMKRAKYINVFMMSAALGFVFHDVTFAMQPAGHHMSTDQVSTSQGSTVSFLVSTGALTIARAVINRFPVLSRMFETPMAEGLSGAVRFLKNNQIPCSDTTITTFAALLQAVAAGHADVQTLTTIIRNAQLSSADLSELAILADMYDIELISEPLYVHCLPYIQANMPLFKQNPDLFFNICAEQFGKPIMQKCMDFVAKRLTLHKDAFSTELEKFKGTLRYQSSELLVTGTRNQTFVWSFNHEVCTFGATPKQTIEGFCEYVSTDGSMIVVEINNVFQAWCLQQASGSYVRCRDIVFNNPDIAAAGFGYGLFSIRYVSADFQDIVLINDRETIHLHCNATNARYNIAHQEVGIFQTMSQDTRTVVLHNGLDRGEPMTIVARLAVATNQYEVFASLQGDFCKANGALDTIVTQVDTRNRVQSDEVRMYRLAPVERQDATVLVSFPGRFVAASDDVSSIMVRRYSDAEHHYHLYVRGQDGDYRDQELIIPGTIVTCSSDMGTLFVSHSMFEQAVSLHKRKILLPNELAWEQVMELFMIEQEQPHKIDFMSLPDEGRGQHANIFASLNPELRRYIFKKYVKHGVGT